MLEKIQLLEKFLATQSSNWGIMSYMLDLTLGASLSLILRGIYIRFGNGVSNRRKFGNNFVLLTLATMIVLSIVKSSPALTLGLIGALSVVRFRSAIKEPEELTYLFLSIVIGLGIGAGIRVVSLIALMFVLLLIYIFYKIKEPNKTKQNLYVLLTSGEKEGGTLETIQSILNKNCSKVKLVNSHQSGGKLALSFWVDLKNIQALSDLKSELQAYQADTELSYLG